MTSEGSSGQHAPTAAGDAGQGVIGHEHGQPGPQPERGAPQAEQHHEPGGDVCLGAAGGLAELDLAPGGPALEDGEVEQRHAFLVGFQFGEGRAVDQLACRLDDHRAVHHEQGLLGHGGLVATAGDDVGAREVELGEQLGEHEVRLGTVHLYLLYPAGIHHRQVRAQLATDLFIGAAQFMLE